MVKIVRDETLKETTATNATFKGKLNRSSYRLVSYAIISARHATLLSH